MTRRLRCSERRPSVTPKQNQHLYFIDAVEANRNYRSNRRDLFDLLLNVRMRLNGSGDCYQPVAYAQEDAKALKVKLANWNESKDPFDNAVKAMIIEVLRLAEAEWGTIDAEIPQYVQVVGQEDFNWKGRKQCESLFGHFGTMLAPPEAEVVCTLCGSTLCAACQSNHEEVCRPR